MNTLMKRLSEQTWWSPRGFLLFVLPLPLIPALIISLGKGEFKQSLFMVIAITLFITGASLNRKGLKLSHYLSESEKKIPPFKLIAAICVAVATGLCSWFLVEQGFLFSLLVSALALTGCYLSYGFESLEQYREDNADTHSVNSNIDHTIAEANEKIRLIENHAQTISDQDIKQRLLRICELALEIISRIEKQPEDRHQARKFLYVYLDGALRVTRGYVSTTGQTEQLALEHKFKNVLVTIEDVFQQQKQHFLKNDLLDLDVQIEVLTKQLRQEGIG